MGLHVILNEALLFFKPISALILDLSYNTYNIVNIASVKIRLKKIHRYILFFSSNNSRPEKKTNEELWETVSRNS